MTRRERNCKRYCWYESYILISVVLGIKSRMMYMLDQCSTTVLQPQLHFLYLLKCISFWLTCKIIHINEMPCNALMHAHIRKCSNQVKETYLHTFLVSLWVKTFQVLNSSFVTVWTVICSHPPVQENRTYNNCSYRYSKIHR